MDLMKLAGKAVLKKVGKAATLVAVSKVADHAEKKAKANMLETKVAQAKQSVPSNEAISSKSFFEEPSVFNLFLVEKGAIKKSYIINDSNGSTLFAAKNEGTKNQPNMVIYTNDSVQIGCVKQERNGTPTNGKPVYTLHHNGKQIASLIQKSALKPKFQISENGWRVETGVTKTTVYDGTGAIAIQVQYLLRANKTTFQIEYLNKQNEGPAMLCALLMVMIFYMG